MPKSLHSSWSLSEKIGAYLLLAGIPFCYVLPFLAIPPLDSGIWVDVYVAGYSVFAATIAAILTRDRIRVAGLLARIGAGLILAYSYVALNLSIGFLGYVIRYPEKHLPSEAAPNLLLCLVPAVFVVTALYFRKPIKPSQLIWLSVLMMLIYTYLMGRYFLVSEYGGQVGYLSGLWSYIFSTAAFVLSPALIAGVLLANDKYEHSR